MFCSYCGGKLEQESIFCTHCGREVPSAQTPMPPTQPQVQMPYPPIQQTPAPVQRPRTKSPKGKYLLFGAGGTAVGAILLAVILLLAGVFGTAGAFSSGGGAFEGPGFATPEDAAKAYLMGLEAQNMDAMLSTFAMESYVENYDFEAQVERLMSYQINMEIRFPNTNDYTRRMNIASRSSQVAGLILFQYMSFNTPDALNDATPVMLNEPGAVSDFVEKFERDTEDYVFEDLEIKDTLKPEDLSDMYENEMNQENIAKQAKTFGANEEDVANIAVTFEADGDEYIFCPQMVRYDGKWYLQSLQGNLANLLGIDVFKGGIMPFDESAF